MSESNFAEVAVPLHVFQTFYYRLPEHLRSSARPGARIVVPLGRTLVTGYIVALSETLLPSSIDEAEVKDAIDILDAVPAVTPELLQITRWVAEYYVDPWGEVIKAALPPGISPTITESFLLTAAGRQEIEKPTDDNGNNIERKILLSLTTSEPKPLATLLGDANKNAIVRALRKLERDGLIQRLQRSGAAEVKEKLQRVVSLAKETESPSRQKLTAPQVRVLEALKEHQNLVLSDLLERAQASASTVNSLKRRGLLHVSLQTVRRDPLAGTGTASPRAYRLTEDQENVLKQLEEPLRQQVYAPFLLHGVTGSGKTEIYIRAMHQALALGRSALMLVPEIALTPVFSRRLRTHFGEQVAIFHSSLSRGERFDEWTRVHAGEARVVIGTRSAVFAPVQNLGLVVVDEEHESTYRQQDSPHYNGRDTAIVRAQKEAAVVILGSATPSLESYHNARSGKYHYLELPKRIGNRPMAPARIIDMRGVFDRHKKPQVFSDELLDAINETHARNEQSIILINRRGYSSFVLCRSCGETIHCPNCDVTLTYHRNERVIVCHYCNHREHAPDKCPNCEGKYIYYIGEGTEQIEEMLKKLCPKLVIARVDRDTTARRRSFEKVLHDFSEGTIDLLVGTQMLAKGHDYPNVTLVGVVSVDAGLALPDFRAAERTFQLITQVAGRAGRGDRPGEVLIQTYHPEHYALRHAAAQDYLGFYNEEIRHRQNHNYPPFVSLASILVRGSDFGRARATALEVRKELDKFNLERGCRILGPAPAPLARLKGEFRIQLLIKSRSRRQIRDVADPALQAVFDRGVNPRSVSLDIDPVSIM